MIPALALLAAAQVPTATVATATVAEVGPTKEEADAFRYAKYAAFVDGIWSGIMTGAWGLSARTWQAPYPEAALAIVAARVLYGTTWTILVAANTALLRFITGDKWEGIQKGSLRNHWYIGFDIPAPCERGGGDTCGLGLGGYSEISVTLNDLEVVMSGGWVQGRYDTDDRRTMMESTWVQSPLILRERLRADLGPIGVETVLGGGIYAGMHNAHVHPRLDFRDAFDVPAHEIVVLHAGAGLGLHAKLALDLFDVVTIDAELDLAPFYLSVAPDRPDVVKELDRRKDGTVVWRRATVGIGTARGVLPIRLALRLYGLELGPGPVEDVGHRGMIIQFETPFDLEEDEEEEDE